MVPQVSKTDPIFVKKNMTNFLKNMVLDLPAWELRADMDAYLKAPGTNDEKRLYYSVENTAEIKPSNTSQLD